eukprot:Hpha_TRINITY_DN4146_c0_g1::TRINITY_DN4146_c0_g1_i1::g.194848::m.194848
MGRMPSCILRAGHGVGVAGTRVEHGLCSSSPHRLITGDEGGDYRAGKGPPWLLPVEGLAWLSREGSAVVHPNAAAELLETYRQELPKVWLFNFAHVVDCQLLPVELEVGGEHLNVNPVLRCLLPEEGRRCVVVRRERKPLRHLRRLCQTLHLQLRQASHWVAERQGHRGDEKPHVDHALGGINQGVLPHHSLHLRRGEGSAVLPPPAAFELHRHHRRYRRLLPPRVVQYTHPCRQVLLLRFLTAILLPPTVPGLARWSEPQRELGLVGREGCELSRRAHGLPVHVRQLQPHTPSRPTLCGWCLLLAPLQNEPARGHPAETQLLPR